MDRIVVLRDGLRKINQFDCLPREFRETVTTETTVLGWLNAMEARGKKCAHACKFYTHA